MNLKFKKFNYLVSFCKIFYKPKISLYIFGFVTKHPHFKNFYYPNHIIIIMSKVVKQLASKKTTFGICFWTITIYTIQEHAAWHVPAIPANRKKM